MIRFANREWKVETGTGQAVISFSVAVMSTAMVSLFQVA
jgi:hypothetical protein